MFLKVGHGSVTIAAAMPAPNAVPCASATNIPWLRLYRLRITPTHYGSRENEKNSYCGVQGASALSKSANYPRSAPRVFGGDGAPLIAPLSPISTVHVRNGSLWCYNDADIAEIIPLSDEDTEGRGASLPSWALPVIVAGAPL